MKSNPINLVMKIIPQNLPVLISLVFILAGPVAFAEPPVPVPIDPANYSAPIRVACVGDSITAGFKVEKGKSYPDQLQEILGDKWEVKNFGVSARTLLKKGDHPYENEKAYTDAQDYRPNVVIIMLGTNDTKPQNWVHHDEFYADYKDMVKVFKRTGGSKLRIFICRPCPTTKQSDQGINEPDIQLEIPVIDQLAADEGVDIIDMHAALAGRTELLQDRIHPNSEGAGLLAQAAAQALTGKAPASTSSPTPDTTPAPTPASAPQ